LVAVLQPWDIALFERASIPTPYHWPHPTEQKDIPYTTFFARSLHRIFIFQIVTFELLLNMRKAHRHMDRTC
jgi:hypothetical protein